jgi:hypothetical protein
VICPAWAGSSKHVMSPASSRITLLAVRCGWRLFLVELSHFMIDRPVETDYCSAHTGLPVPTSDGRQLIVNA